MNKTIPESIWWLGLAVGGERVGTGGIGGGQLVGYKLTLGSVHDRTSDETPRELTGREKVALSGEVRSSLQLTAVGRH